MRAPRRGRGVESSRAAATPRRCRKSIWSFISAISGETTTVSAVEQQRRQLVAEDLAAAGREDRERRPPGEERLDDLLLPGAERGEAEALGEHVERRVACVNGHPGRLRVDTAKMCAARVTI